MLLTFNLSPGAAFKKTRISACQEEPNREILLMPETLKVF